MVTIEDFKIDSSKKIVDDVNIQVVYIPLRNNVGISYNETVKTGDYVYIGSVIGKNAMIDTPLISSVSGYVVGFIDKYISDGSVSRCIVIENDFKDKYLNKLGKRNDITKYSKDEFIYLLKNSAIYDISGYPLYPKYDTKNKIDYLIINGAECEIYASSDNALMYNNVEEILEATDAIMEIMGIKKAYIAINEKNVKVIARFMSHINTYPNIKIYPLIDAYPNGYDRFLVSNILSLTYDKHSTEVGVICQNVYTTYAIYEMLKYNKPMNEVIVSINGNGIKKPANYKLRIGTNINELFLKTDILKKIKDPLLIAGGAMMGISLPTDSVIVTANCRCFLVISKNEDEEMECINCGKCSEVCPLNLIPSMIIDNPKEADKLHIDKCINCGLCSYVCPSKIKITEIIKKIKGGYSDEI